MNKTELIKNVAQNAEISQKEATVVVQTVVESITNTLAAGKSTTYRIRYIRSSRKSCSYRP